MQRRRCVPDFSGALCGDRSQRIPQQEHPGEHDRRTRAGKPDRQLVWIHHNYFHDFTSPAEGAENIRFGLSGLNLPNGYGQIEHPFRPLYAPSRQRARSLRQLLPQLGRKACVRRPPHLQQLFREHDTHEHRQWCRGSGRCRRPDHARQGLRQRHRVQHARQQHAQLLSDGRTNGLGAINTVFASSIVQGRRGGQPQRPVHGGVREGHIIWQTAGAGGTGKGHSTKLTRCSSRKLTVCSGRRGSPAIDSAVGESTK